METPVAEVDAVVVGSGPNGLAAAVVLARAGLSVTVYERADTLGGGTRTAELTLPGFRHDVCSAVHPMAAASEFFQKFELERRIRMITPEVSYAHPLDGGRAGIAFRDLDRTADALGSDGRAWRRTFGSLVDHIADIADMSLTPLVAVPRHPASLVRLGLRVLEQGSPLWSARFRDDVAPAMLTGVAAHAIGRMPSLATSSVGTVLAAHAHAGGWPIPEGGTQAIADAMADDIRAHGGTFVTGQEITSLDELPDARVVLLDVTPRALLRMAGDRLPAGYRRAMRQFRYGDGVAKVDFALSGPVPWANEDARAAVTLHVGGSRAEIARGEADVARGRHPESPYVLVAQPTVVDPTRAPAGSHVLWAYTHVPRGSTIDMSEAITAQIERFAPGFRDVIIATSSISAAEYENYNPNYIGGDISGGALSMLQIARRPILSADPWRTPLAGVYLSSSSAVPGTGVHGMAGYQAARSALRREFGRAVPQLGID